MLNAYTRPLTDGPFARKRSFRTSYSITRSPWGARTALFPPGSVLSRALCIKLDHARPIRRTSPLPPGENMTKGQWLKPALDYISRWVEFQVRQHEQRAGESASARND